MSSPSREVGIKDKPLFKSNVCAWDNTRLAERLTIIWPFGGVWRGAESGRWGGAWSTGSTGAIGSDCRQVSAIRPNQEVCIYVSALPFSRRIRQERKTDPRGTEREAKSRQRACPQFLGNFSFKL